MAEAKKADEGRAILPELSKEEKEQRKREDEAAEKDEVTVREANHTPALDSLDPVKVKDPEGVVHEMVRDYWNLHKDRLEDEGWELVEKSK